MSRSRRESAGAMAKPPTTEMTVQTARILRRISMTSPCADAADSEGVVACRSGQPVACSIAIGAPQRRGIVVHASALNSLLAVPALNGDAYGAIARRIAQGLSGTSAVASLTSCGVRP